jgi:hypothetical protein
LTLWTGAWPSRDITNLQRALKELKQLTEHPSGDQPDEVSRALARFLVVRTCGFLEQVIEECCRALILSKASPQVAAFGASWFGRGFNPTPDRIVSLVKRFDSMWATELEEKLEADDELLSRELSFLVDRRNKIAHGLSEGLGARKALDLVAAAEELADWFIARFDPQQ